MAQFPFCIETDDVQVFNSIEKKIYYHNVLSHNAKYNLSAISIGNQITKIHNLVPNTFILLTMKLDKEHYSLVSTSTMLYHLSH